QPEQLRTVVIAEEVVADDKRVVRLGPRLAAVARGAVCPSSNRGERECDGRRASEEPHNSPRDSNTSDLGSYLLQMNSQGVGERVLSTSASFEARGHSPPCHDKTTTRRHADEGREAIFSPHIRRVKLLRRHKGVSLLVRTRERYCPFGI